MKCPKLPTAIPDGFCPGSPPAPLAEHLVHFRALFPRQRTLVSAGTPNRAIRAESIRLTDLFELHAGINNSNLLAVISGEKRFPEDRIEPACYAISQSALVSRLVNPFPKSSAETGHFQGGVKLPLRRFAEPLRGATPPPSNSPAVARPWEYLYLGKLFTRRATRTLLEGDPCPGLPSNVRSSLCLPTKEHRAMRKIRRHAPKSTCPPILL